MDRLPHWQAEQCSVGAVLLDKSHALGNLVASERRGADQRRNAPIDHLQNVCNENAIILCRQRSAFTCRPQCDQSRCAVANEHLDEFGGFRKVDRVCGIEPIGVGFGRRWYDGE